MREWKGLIRNTVLLHLPALWHWQIYLNDAEYYKQTGDAENMVDWSIHFRTSFHADLSPNHYNCDKKNFYNGISVSVDTSNNFFNPIIGWSDMHACKCIYKRFL